MCTFGRTRWGKFGTWLCNLQVTEWYLNYSGMYGNITGFTPRILLRHHRGEMLLGSEGAKSIQEAKAIKDSSGHMFAPKAFSVYGSLFVERSFESQAVTAGLQEEQECSPFNCSSNPHFLLMIAP